MYTEINLPPASNLLHSIHSAASHAAHTPLLRLLETWSLCGCTFWKSPTVAPCFSGCPICHQNCDGGQKGSTFRKSFCVHHLPDVPQVWDGLGFWFWGFFGCMIRSYGLFLWAETHGKEWHYRWGAKVLSACSLDVLFPCRSNRTSLLSLDWSWANPVALAGEVWRPTCTCDARTVE